MYRVLLLMSLVLGLIIGGISPAVGGNYQSDPDDAEICQAAAKAAAALPADRRGLDFAGTSVKITGYQGCELVGFQARQVSGTAVDLQKVLSDLDARRVGRRIQITMSGDVLFAFDKCDIRLDAEADLYKLVKAIKQMRVEKIEIDGHTDAKGSDEYNLHLSERRAQAVKDWLVRKGGLAPDRMITMGWGEQRPISPNTNPDGSDNPAGRAQNRRVEIVIYLSGDQ